MKPNRDFSFNVKVLRVKVSAIFRYQCNVDVATRDTGNQKYHHCNPGSTRQTQYPSLVPKIASDYDLVLANFKIKLKAWCCSKSIRIRFDLDKLKEPEIE